MSKESKSTGSYAVTISTAVGIVFIILKLCGVIDWSWWAVTAPIWVVWGLIFGIIIVAVVIAFFTVCIATAVEKMKGDD